MNALPASFAAPSPGPSITPAAPVTPVAEPTLTPRAFACQCGRPVFFPNSTCLACGTPLGYAPGLVRLLPLQVVDGAENLWAEHGAAPDSPRWLRCANLLTAAGCNWLVDAGDAPTDGAAPLCRCCRLTRTLPDLSVAENLEPWHRIELAKRRLVSSLMALKLPVQSKVEDPEQGLAFDLLRALPGGPKVMTGHADGVITLDVAEADDAVREERRQTLNEPYRTLLGHLRHESGHYYWDRLVRHHSEWLTPFRTLFGDEQADYAAALKAHYENGPSPDWGGSFVSAYASSHPWEDWAETWAHYLHMIDTVDTAASFGLDAAHLDIRYEPFTAELLAGPADAAVPIDANAADLQPFLALVHSWMELTGVLNELSRSMGLADFYPFVLPLPAVRKLYFVHRVVHGAVMPSAEVTQAPPA